jgi:hypothetical protein
MAQAFTEVWGRVVGGARRRVVNTPALRPFFDRRRFHAMQHHQAALPSLDGAMQHVLATIDADAICYTDAEAIGMASLLMGPELAAAAVELQRLVDAHPDRSIVRLPRTSVEAYGALYLAGLSARITDLVENYLRLPPVYLGVEFKVERADGREETVRRWHCDVEDDRMLKILVYLNDVDGDGGGFEYLPAADTLVLRDRLRYRSGYLADAVAAAELPSTITRLCTGARGTAMLFDGTRLFHRAQPPRGADRVSLTYTYTTRFVRQIMPGAQLSGPAKHRILGLLTPELRRFLP